MPIAVVLVFFPFAQPDRVATSLRTPAIRSLLKPSPAGLLRGVASRSRRNCSGSLPAALDSSSMNDWYTHATALLRGARSAPVGTPSGISEHSIAKFGTSPLGNSVLGMFADCAKVFGWFAGGFIGP